MVTTGAEDGTGAGAGVEDAVDAGVEVGADAAGV